MVKASPSQTFLSRGLVERTYRGSKWGIFLRAPKIFFVLKRRCGTRLVPLATLARLRFGLKSGCDEFFFPRDITDEVISDYSDEELKRLYGLGSKDIDKVRLLKAGDGSVHLLESRFVEPEIHGLMDIDQIGIEESSLARCVVMIPTGVLNKNSHAHKYVRWGESEGFNTGKTCRSRVTADRAWHDLTGRERGKIIWPKLQQYRHVVAHNPKGITCNCNLYDVFARYGIDHRALCAVLNSTIVAMMKFLFGSQMGREANQVTEIFDAKMMLVPDIRDLQDVLKDDLIATLSRLKARKTKQLLDVDSEEQHWTGELADVDRQHLDDVTFRVLGVTDSRERISLRNQLYADITQLYRHLRAAEKKMQRFRAIGARKGKVTAQSISDAIWEHLPSKPEYKELTQFVDGLGSVLTIDLPIGKPHIKKATLFHKNEIQIGTFSIEFAHLVQCEYVKRLVDGGESGLVKIPRDPTVCEKAMKDFDAEREVILQQFRELAATSTADERLQSRVVSGLWKRMTADVHDKATLKPAAKPPVSSTSRSIRSNT